MNEFRATVLGQLGEPRLGSLTQTSRVQILTQRWTQHEGSLRDIHRRVGAAILFESSGGQVNKVAHLPELRFAIGDRCQTTSVDNAAHALETAFLSVASALTDSAFITRPPFGRRSAIVALLSMKRRKFSCDAELVEAEFKRGAVSPLPFQPTVTTFPIRRA